MQDVRDALSAWFANGRRVVLSTLVVADGHAPRDPGASFAVSDTGDVAGAISGGCVESTLVDVANAILHGDRARATQFGPDDLLDAGLTCGGTITVVSAELTRETFEAFERAERSALAIRLDADFAHAIIDDRHVTGTLGSSDFTEGVADEARAMLAASKTTVRGFGDEGEPTGDERVFIATFVEPPLLYIIGAIDFAKPLTAIARVLGYRSIVIDPRAAFAVADRFPEADRVIAAWPDDALRTAFIDDRTAIVTLAHDPKFDLPTLEIALRSSAAYVGAMGSRSTNEKRLAALRERGSTERELARLHAPIGLDLGSRTPEETAISIVAEIVASRHGRSGGALTGGRGPLRGTIGVTA